MALTKEGYTERLIDKKLNNLLDIFGAVSIIGPKYCGKTWTASNHSNTIFNLTKSDNLNSDYRRALIDRELVLNGSNPILLDEWQFIEQLWDDVRTKCDEDGKTGKYILTGSSVPVDPKNIAHSGAGRICKLYMYTMSLFESKDSEGSVSLESLFNNEIIIARLKNKPTLDKLADLIIRGGWPASLKLKKENYYLLPESYIEDVLDHDISYDGVDRDKNKMRMLMKSLARNETTIVSNETLIKDIDNYVNEEAYQVSRNTVSDYLNVLENIHLIKDQEPYSENIRSRTRVGKSSKRHFIDPSLPCSLLGVKQEQLIKDLELFGFMFEALVVRDLRIYIEYLGGKIYHFRDNNTGEEIDAIVEQRDGRYGAIEVKLGVGSIDEAAKNLINFSKKCDIKPTFLCVISGMIDYAYKREDGVYVVPITALKP